MDQYAFVWRGKDPKGTVRGERVVAPNAQLAREKLATAGWSDLQLIKDEIAVVASRMVERDDFLDDAVQTPNEEAQSLEKKSAYFAEWIKDLWQVKKSI